jgi:hypothetical protein
MKVLRRISGPLNDRGIWRVRSNKDLADLYEEIYFIIIIIIWLYIPIRSLASPFGVS